MATLTMTCLQCGAGCSGTLAEVLAWDKSHPEHCPGHPAVTG